MYLEVNATMTMKEWLEKNPDFYDNLLQSEKIDDATVEMLFRYFSKRIICDDDNFGDFYMRALMLYLPRYNKLLRIENTDFDALVSTYREHQIQTSSSYKDNTKVEKTANVNSQNDTNNTTTRTPGIRQQTSVNNSSESNSNAESAGESSSKSSASTKDVEVSKMAPQSISYEESKTGEIPGLNWQYPSSQEQNEGESKSEMSGTSSNNTNTTAKNKNKSLSTTNTTGKETTVIDIHSKLKNKSTDKSDTSHTGSKDDLSREIWTGRDGLTPQEALETAMKYIKFSSAFTWLKYMLDSCFLAIYEI